MEWFVETGGHFGVGGHFAVEGFQPTNRRDGQDVRQFPDVAFEPTTDRRFIKWSKKFSD